MKALTIRQPWATLIALGVKTIETRSWRTNYRGPLAIHAGVHQPDGGPVGDWKPYKASAWNIEHFGAGTTGMLPGADGYARLPLGAVVATCTLADCVPMVGCWEHDDDRHCLWLEGSILTHKVNGLIYQDRWTSETPMTDQLPYGDFRPGRWAWLLENITPCDPVPAKGKQGLWKWQP